MAATPVSASAPSRGSSRPARLPDGRYLLATVGTRRFRVREWLSDDPFPRAEVELLDEPGVARRCRGRPRRRRAPVDARAGDVAPKSGTHRPRSTSSLDDDPAQASFEAAAAAPIGPLDAQRLLELDDPGERLAQLRSLLADQAELLELRLSGT